MKVKIQWLEAKGEDCDHAGCSGGFDALGALVTTDDGKVIYESVPYTSCFGDNGIEECEVYRAIVYYLADEVEEVNG